MPFNWGLLSDQSLANQPPEIQQGLQEQATKQFLLGTLLGGGLKSGYTAAQAVPEQYQTRVEQQAFDRALAGARRNAMTVESAGPVMPGQAAPVEIRPEAFSPERFLQQLPGVVAQAGPRAKVGNVKEFADLFSKTANQVKDGLIVSPAGNIVGIAPRIDTERGTFTTGQMVDGQPSLQMSPIAGAREARMVSALPNIAPNTQFVNIPGVGVGIAPLPNAPQTVQQLRAAEALGQAAGELVEITLADGSKAQVPKSQLLAAGGQQRPAQPTGQAAPSAAQPAGFGGIPSAPSAAQAALNADYAPILQNARKADETSRSMSPALQSLRRAIDSPSFDTNKLTSFKAPLVGFFNAFGVTGKNAEQYLGNFTAAQQAVKDLSIRNLSDLSGAISNFEIGYSEQRGARITDPKQSIRYYLDLTEAANDRKRAYYNFVQKNPTGDVNALWAESAQGQSGIFESPRMRKYLDQRPVASGPNKGKTAYNLPSGEWVVFD